MEVDRWNLRPLPQSRRRGGALTRFAVVAASALVLACAAAAGATWSRTQSPTVTLPDALRILTSSADAAEREQAMAAAADIALQVVAALSDAERSGETDAKYATLWLKQIADAASKRAPASEDVAAKEKK